MQSISAIFLTSIAIVGGAVATYFTGTLKNYFIYIAVLILIMVALSVVSVMTKPQPIEPHEEHSEQQ